MSQGSQHQQVLACVLSIKQMMSAGTKYSCQNASSTKFDEFQSSQVPRYDSTLNNVWKHSKKKSKFFCLCYFFITFAQVYNSVI